MDYFAIAAAIFGAVFWVKAAEMENRSAAIWGAISVLVSGIVLFGLHGGWLAVIAAQVAMFIGVALYRTWMDTRKAADE